MTRPVLQAQLMVTSGLLPSPMGQEEESPFNPLQGQEAQWKCLEVIPVRFPSALGSSSEMWTGNLEKCHPQQPLTIFAEMEQTEA